MMSPTSVWNPPDPNQQHPTEKQNPTMMNTMTDEPLHALATTAALLVNKHCPVCNKRIRGLCDDIKICGRAFRIRKLRMHSQENHNNEPIWETVKYKRRQRGGSALDMVAISMCSAVSHVPLPNVAPEVFTRCIERIVASRFGWSRCWIYCGQVHFLERKWAKQGGPGPLGAMDQNTKKSLRREAVSALYMEGEKFEAFVESKDFRDAICHFTWDRIVNLINLLFVLGIEKGKIAVANAEAPTRI